MRAAFLGTPSAAVPSLAALLEIADVELVVTRPNRPKGRSLRDAEPPVKAAASEWGLRVEQPESGPDLVAALEERDLDVALVVAYGRILSARALAATRVGFVNVHFSLLPRWRGAAPVERAILTGDDVTGVSLMHIDEGLDTGAIINAHETEIGEEETAGSLTGRLASLGASMVTEVLPDFVHGRRNPAPQIEAGVLYADRLTSADARLDPADSAVLAARQVRAFHPRPGAWTTVEGKRLRVLDASYVAADVEPGHIEVDAGYPVMGFSDGGLVLTVVQPAGKRPQPGAAWVSGRRGAPAVVDETG
ncbi:MAG: methionyl-tRNA formyltransferase [Acidimicrobiia bacterium]